MTRSELRKKCMIILYQIDIYNDRKINYDIDESLIAGMVIRIGDRVVDSSVKHKIDELARNLKNIQLA